MKTSALFTNRTAPSDGWHQGVPGPPGGSGTPESRPQLEELRSGERVTEPAHPGPSILTTGGGVPAVPHVQLLDFKAATAPGTESAFYEQHELPCVHGVA